VKNGIFFAVAAMAAMSLPTAGPASVNYVPARRGPAPPILTRRGESVNPLELHKLARKNARRKHRRS
jgi:hypothetical protein